MPSESFIDSVLALKGLDSITGFQSHVEVYGITRPWALRCIQSAVSFLAQLETHSSV